MLGYLDTLKFHKILFLPGHWQPFSAIFPGFEGKSSVTCCIAAIPHMEEVHLHLMIMITYVFIVMFGPKSIFGTSFVLCSSLEITAWHINAQKMPKDNLGPNFPKTHLTELFGLRPANMPEKGCQCSGRKIILQYF